MRSSRSARGSLLALLLVAAVALLLWTASRGGADGELAARAAERSDAARRSLMSGSPSEADTSREAASVAAPEEQGDVAPADPDDAEPQLTGLVVDSTGALVTDAFVRFGPIDRRFLPTGSEATEGVTDIAGRFRIPLRLLGHTSHLTIRSDRHASHSRRLGPFHGSADVGTFVLSSTSVLEGRVVDEQGHPIEGAELIELDPLDEDVEFFRPEVEREVLGVSDRAGRFSIRGPTTPGLVSFAARHPRYMRAVTQVRVHADEPVTSGIEVRMSRGASVRGRVTGLTDAELARAGHIDIAVAPRAALEWIAGDTVDEFERRIPLAEDRSFEIGGLRAGERILLSVWMGTRRDDATERRSALVIATASTDPLADPIEVAYVPPGLAHIRFHTPDGRPLDRISFDPWGLVFRGKDGIARHDSALVALDDGLIEFEVWSEDRRPVAISGSAWLDGVGRYELEELEVRPGNTVVDLGVRRLTPMESDTVSAPSDELRTITVHLVDQDGAPVPGGRCQHRTSDAKHRWSHSFIVDKLGIGQVFVRKDATTLVRLNPYPHAGVGYPSMPANRSIEHSPPWIEVPPGDDCTITVVKPVMATADIVVTLDDVPLPAATVMMCLEDWLPLSGGVPFIESITPRGVRTDGSGVARTPEVLPGEWRAWVYHRSLRMPEVFHLRLSPGHNEAQLDRVRTAVTGRVVDTSGSPIEGATVRAEYAGIHPIRTQHGADPSRARPLLGGSITTAALRDVRAVQTDADGRFELEGVTPRRDIVAVAMAEQHVIAESIAVRLEPGDRRAVPDIVLTPSGQLRVILPERHDGDLWLDQVTDEASTDAQHPGLWASIRGDRLVDGIPAGEWTLKVLWYSAVEEDSESSEYDTRVTIVAGETHTEDLRPLK